MGFLDDVSASLNRGVNAVGRSGKAAQIKLQMSELLKQRKDMAAAAERLYSMLRAASYTKIKSHDAYIADKCRGKIH